jgi:hypothetical protein
VRALLQDRGSQLAYGLSASTFTFAILALREVDAVGGGTVPGPTVLVAYLVMPASIAALFLYIHHAGNSLRAAGLIDLVGDHLHEQIDRLDPADGSAPTTRDVVVCPEPGIVVDLDRPALVAAAHDADCVLELAPMMGALRACRCAPVPHLRTSCPPGSRAARAGRAGAGRRRWRRRRCGRRAVWLPACRAARGSCPRC